MFKRTIKSLRNAITQAVQLKNRRHRQRLKLDIKYRLFVFDRKWQLHPVFRFIYPKPGMTRLWRGSPPAARRIIVCVLAFMITGAGFLGYMHMKAQADWYSTSWVYRKAITINHTKVPSTQTNFPVLITTTDTSLAANAQQLGEDILFTSSDGTTKLSHEIESYASASGKLVAWVKIPSLSSTADTTIYMYYGNPSVSSQQDVGNVWDSNFAAVYHMKENPATTNCPTNREVCDSKGVNNMDMNGSMTASDQVNGQIDGALDFDGSNDSLSAADHASLDITSAITISSWVYQTADSVSGFETILNKDTGTIDANYGFQVYQNNTVHIFTNGASGIDQGSNTAVLKGRWVYLSATIDTATDTVRIYMDGRLDAQVTNETGTFTVNNDALEIGQSPAANEQFPGMLDEVRISNIARSTDWVTTEYNNQATPSAFFTFGNQQQKKNPILFWKFDEGNGLTANDASGMGNSGTISGATWQNKDVCLFEGSCLKFDGNDDYVRRLQDGSSDAWCNDTNSLHGCTATWSARMKITFAGNVATNNLTNFPVLVKLDSTRINYNIMQSAGQDIRFIDPSNPNSVLPHEIESWNNGGTSYVWVKVPQIDGNSKTDYIWMYYGNSAPPYAQQVSSVWDSDYLGVWHMDETSNQHQDSTSPANDATTTSVSTQGSATGRINGASDFNNAADNVIIPDAANLDAVNTFTLSAWANPDTIAAGVYDCPVFKNNYWFCFTNSSEMEGGFISTGDDFSSVQSTGASIQTDTLAYFEVVFDDTPDTVTLYRNGSQIAQGSTFGTVPDTDSTSFYNSGVLRFGSNPVGDEEFDGIVDEVRISDVVRSSDWRRAEYLTALDQFNTYAPESVNPKLDPGDDSFSVGAWFRHPATITGQDTIIARADAVNGVGYKMYFDATAGLCFGIDGAAGSFPSDKACSTNTYNDNQWHFVEAVKNGTTSITLYVDGQQVNQDASITSSSLSGVASPFYVGMDADGSSNGWDGYIDEVRVYDYARSAAEVKADYTAKGSALGLSTSIGITDPKSALNQGLVSYWKMDDGVGNACSSGVDKACDSSGNGNVGTWNGQVASTSGKFGYGTTYDGNNDYIQVSDTNSLDLDTQVTVSAWINSTSYSGGAGTYRDIIVKGGFANYALQTNGDELEFSFYNGASYNEHITTNANLQANTWYHVAATFDENTDTVKLFVNGTLQYINTSETANMSANSSALYIGNNDAFSEDWSGRIDEARIYNRALSPTEITNLYDWAPGPVAHWKLDDKTGTTAKDSSGYGNTGSLVSTNWSSGKYGGAGKFTGDESYIDIDETNFYNPKHAIAVSAWVKLNSLKDWNRVVSRDDWASGGFNSWLMYIDAAGIARFGVSEGTDQYNAASSTIFVPNRWYHIEGIYDGTNTAIYINGVLEDTTAISNLVLSPVTNLDISASGNDAMDGSIDDVRIYHYARTSKQVIQDMNAGHPAVGSPVGSALVHLKLDDGFGNVASNSGNCGSTCNGNLTNMSSPATFGSGWNSNGKFGKAVALDGTNDHIGIPDTATLEPTEITLSAWINPAQLTGFQGIISKKESGGYQIALNDPDCTASTLCFMVRVGGAYRYATVATSRLETNTWQHIMGTYDGTNVKLYLNGKLAGSSVTSGVIQYVSDNYIIVGAESSSGATPDPSSYFRGKIDEVKIYNYALNDNETKLEFNNGKAVMFGALGTNPDGTASNSAARAYCPPGNAETNCAGTGVLNPMPVGEWKFDERKGNLAQDTSGNGNTGTLTNNPKWGSGRVGAAVNLDGTDDYVTVPNSTTLSPTSSLTISAWVYERSRATGFEYDMIVAKRRSGNLDSYHLGITPAGEIRYCLEPSGGAVCIETGSVSLNTWTHLTATWDGSTMRIYKNGVLEPETASQPNTLDYGAFATLIGTQDQSGALEGYFDGFIDNVRIYNYARTQAQVAWDYNKGQPLARYAFDECSGNTLHNYAVLPIATVSASQSWGTRYGTSGTNTSSGTCLSGSGSEAWANGNTGKFNSSLDFDGTDDQVLITDNNFGNMGANQDFTVAAWVKTSQTAAESMYPTIFSKERFTSQTGYGLFLHEGNIGDVDPRWYGEIYIAGTGYLVYGASDVADGSWHHLVFQRSGSTLKTYQDGKLAQTVTAVTSDLSTGTNITMGRANDDNNLSYDGQLDDVMLFNYALSTSQIQVLYNQNAAVRFGPLSGRP